MSKIEVNQISSQCGSTLTIGQSGDTVTLACGATAAGFGSTGEVSWDTTKKTSGFIAVSGVGYFCDTTSGAITVTMPATPSAGDIVGIKDYAGTFATNNVTVGRNGSLIDATASDATLSTSQLSVFFVYVDGTQGWKATQSDAGSYGAQYIVATGGTVTCCGDYRIHTFTGPGTLCVSCAGNSAGSNTVDYLVVAGGGGSGTQIAGNGGGGGGGAGGYRESSGAASGCYTRSPLGACVSALPVTAQGYPITVGAGGAGVPSSPPGCRGNPGSNSVFSTITSTGGGGSGASIPGGVEPGLPGGSGGGAGQTGGGYPKTGGSGNTPPTSPPQGNPGGNTTIGAPNFSGSGGGGATAAGANQTATAGGNGGAGATTSISGSSTSYAGGGGGGVYQAGTSGNGGAGGGGDAGAPNQNDAGDAGGTNTGGGAGGASSTGSGTPVAGSAGGSGIVIIRYKYQN